MALSYADLKAEIKRRGVRDQGGTQFDTGIGVLANASLLRLSREAMWKALRRKRSFDTEGEQTTGTMSATNGSSSFTGASLSLITNNIQVGRRFNIQGSTREYIIETITGENAFTADRTYDGTTASGLTHTIFGREEYNLPIQTGRVAFLWHEAFGVPEVLSYVPDLSFYQAQPTISTGDTPTHYRMWGEDDIIEQPLEPAVLRVFSSVSGDTSKSITVFGTVSDYPDFETITTNSSNGTTAVSGTKLFQTVERITKDASTAGRITVDTNSANAVVARLPVGDATSRIQYKKIQLWPLPDTILPIHVQYYKDPWRLVNDADVHELGQEFDESIILLSVAKIKYENSQEEGDRWLALYKDEVSSLKKVNADKLDYVFALRRHRDEGPGSSFLHPHVRFNQLGALYGPMSRS